MAEDQLDQLRDEAYAKVFFAFTHDQYTLDKERVLTGLREELRVTPGRHKELSEEASVRRKRMASAQAHYEPAHRNHAHNISSSYHHTSDSYHHSHQHLPISPPRPYQEPATQNGAYADDYGNEDRYANAPAQRARKAAVLPAKMDGRKRLKKVEDNGPAHSSRAPARQTVGDTNPLIGYVVQRNWPQDGWCEGLITDYRQDTEEHCICYDMGQVSETYEWFDIQNSGSDECILTDELRIPKLAAPNQQHHAAARQLPSASGQALRKAGSSRAGTAAYATASVGYR